MAQGLKGTFTKPANTLLLKSLDDYARKSEYKKYCTISPSTGESETYEWLAGLPGLREWIGPRVIQGLQMQDYTLKNKKYEGTIGFNIDKLNDNPKIVKARIPMLAQACMDSIDGQFFTAVVAGASALCHNGVSFYNDTHPADFDGGSTFDNIVTGAGASVANIKTDFDKAKVMFLGFVQRNGRKLFRILNPKGLMIFHSIALDSAMREVFDIDKLTATGAPNMYYKQAQHQAVGDLSGNDWYISITDKAIKPWMFQVRDNLKGKWDETGSFDTQNIKYGVDGRWVFGYTMPQLSVLIDN